MAKRHTPPSRGTDTDPKYVLDDGKEPWAQIEERVCDWMGWDRVEADTHDAVDAGGETVEIKSCIWRYADGGYGRAKIWEDQYWEADRLALVVYCDYVDHAEIIGIRDGPMRVMRGPHNRQNHPTMGRRARYCAPLWTDILDVWDVRGRFRHGLEPKLVGNAEYLPVDVANVHEPMCLWRPDHSEYEQKRWETEDDGV